MVHRKSVLLSGCGVVALLFATSARAETVTFSYDALGRLTASSVSGGPNGGVTMKTCFDAAGNRSQYVVATSGGANCSNPPSSAPASASTPAPSPSQ